MTPTPADPLPAPPVAPGPPVRELVLTRLIAAPRELVFRAWTDPRHMAQWWGPANGFTTPVCELDPRPGGALRIDMRSPDGTIYPMTGMFEEVVPPERLVFTTHAFVAETGEFLLDGRTTVTLVAQAGQTQLTLHTVILAASPAAAGPLAGMEPGWNATLDRVAAYTEALQRSNYNDR